mmetsp:Transcript_7350/g.8489  ORF Transcript_7350/g.8489 Transcript_7350/m.8489 type:complete len:160 (+) Transcript_7350:288-767(+)
MAMVSTYPSGTVLHYDADTEGEAVTMRGGRYGDGSGNSNGGSEDIEKIQSRIRSSLSRYLDDSEQSISIEESPFRSAVDAVVATLIQEDSVQRPSTKKLLIDDDANATNSEINVNDWSETTGTEDTIPKLEVMIISRQYGVQWLLNDDCELLEPARFTD